MLNVSSPNVLKGAAITFSTFTSVVLVPIQIPIRFFPAFSRRLPGGDPLTVDAGPEVYELFENCPGGSLSELRTLSITDSVFMDGDIDEEDRYVGVVIEAFSFTPIYADCSYPPLPLTSLSLSAKTLHNGIEEFSVSLLIRLSMSRASYQQCRH